MYTFKKYSCDSNSIRNRIQQISEKTLTNKERQFALRQILSCIDLTTLSGDDNNKKVTDLCTQGIAFKSDQKKTHAVAAICVYPIFAEIVHQTLLNTNIKTACVAGAFPSGQSPIGLRIDEVAYAVEMGAEEIDMVISRGKLIEGDTDYIFQEVEAIKSACGEAHLKVILETGELKTIEHIRKASEISILAGADFIKTSTGKVQPAATPEAFMVMLDTIKEYHQETGKKIGIKPAGGISTPDEAILYHMMVKDVLGNEWLNSHLFRIGASRLAQNLFNEITT